MDGCYVRGLRGQAAQGTVEYGLLIASGALLVVVAMLYFGGTIDGVFDRAAPSTPTPTQFTPPVANCDASYEGVCIPPAPPDLDCADLVSMGIPVPVTVVGSDPHGLDPDGDGLGC